MEKGFWFTSWRMIVGPGQVVKNYIDGQRIRYQKPISFYLIWTAVYLLILSIIESYYGKEEVIYRRNYFGDMVATEIATKYMSISVGILIPVWALFIRWCGMKRFYNFTEAMTAVLFVLGAILMMQTLYSVFVLIIFLWFDLGVSSNVSDIMKAVYLGWFSFSLIHVYSLKRSVLRATALTVASIGLYVLWRIYGFAFLWHLIAGE